MKKQVTEEKYYRFIKQYPHFENLTWYDDSEQCGRRVIKDKVLNKNVASIQRSTNRKPVCFITED